MDIINIVSFFLGVMSLVLTIYYGVQSNRTIDTIWNHVDHKVIELLTQRLNRAEPLSTAQVIGIIRNITTEYRVNMPSDQHIVQLLRRIALRYEEDDVSYHHGKLKSLEKIRKELEPKGPPLLSIATMSRSLAFRLFVYGTMISLLVLHVIIIVFSVNLNKLVVIAFLLAEILVASLMLVASIESRKILRSISATKEQ